MKLALKHLPSGRICDVENGVCYSTFDSVEAAQAYIQSSLAQWASNYEIVGWVDPSELSDVLKTYVYAHGPAFAGEVCVTVAHMQARPADLTPTIYLTAYRAQYTRVEFAA